MKNSTLLSTALLALGLVFATTGCSTFFRPAATAQHITTYALVVSVNDGQPPTDAQWAELQKRFAVALGARGYALVSDPALADRIIHVRFSPDVDDPSTGTAYVVSIKTNPGLLASNTTTSMLPASYASLGYNGGYGYGYNDYSYSDNYYTPTYAVYRPGPHHPDNPPKTTNPADCPPGTTPKDHPGHPDHPPINFVGNYPTHIAPSPDHGHRSHPSSDPGYSRSDSNYSHSDSSYRSSSSSSSSYDGPSTSYSSSASSSAPTMSAPSSWSSSSSDSSSFSSSASSSPAPSSSPPAESSSRAQPN